MVNVNPAFMQAQSPGDVCPNARDEFQPIEIRPGYGCGSVDGSRSLGIIWEPSSHISPVIPIWAGKIGNVGRVETLGGNVCCHFADGEY